jgi:hypothetical protein
MSEDANAEKIVVIGGQRICLSNYPHLSAMVTTAVVPRAVPLTTEEIRQWAMDEAKAGEEIAALVKKAKKAGKDRSSISNLVLTRIAEKHSLPSCAIVSLLAVKWEGKELIGTFDFTKITPEQFFEEFLPQL